MLNRIVLGSYRRGSSSSSSFFYFLFFSLRHIFIDVIEGPGFMRPLLSSSKQQEEHLFASRLSVMLCDALDQYVRMCFDMICFIIAFWDEQKETPGSVLPVEVYCHPIGLLIIC